MDLVGTYCRGVSKSIAKINRIKSYNKEGLESEVEEEALKVSCCPSSVLSSAVEVKGAVAKKGVSVCLITSIVEGSVPMTVASCVIYQCARVLNCEDTA